MEDTSINIILKIADESFIVQAEPSWTVQEFIDNLDRIPNIPPSIVSDYIFGDIKLKDFLDTTLCSLNLTEDSIVVVHNNGGNISVTVKFLTGKVITTTMNSFSTIEDFKQRLQNREGIPPDMVKPVFNGMMLNSMNIHTTFQELGIVDGSIIDVVLNRGG